VIVKIKPSALKGVIQAPASKSSMQRACAAALLLNGKSVIQNPGHSNDDNAAIEIIKRLGATIEINKEGLLINSNGLLPVADEVNCGESGLSIRMFTPIIALCDKKMLITGEGSLLARPMEFFDDILPQLGVRIESNNGRLPIMIKGPMKPKNVEIDGSLSSQFLTGLLMAYSAADAKDVTINVKDLTSKPYIDLTLNVMKQFGLKVPENKKYEEFFFKSETRSRSLSGAKSEIIYAVEGDWSGGAFLLVAGAIAGPITIRGLDMASTQADKAIMEALSNAHANIAVEAKGIKILPSSSMKAFEFDATDCPDLFPPLTALASCCDGQTKIKGVNRLTHKESNRAISLQEEFRKMGVTIQVNDDIMIIHGGKKIKGTKVHSHHDHRIAMACAVAALKGTNETTIEEGDAVNKSYPDFYDDLIKLGADVSLSSRIKFHE